VNHLIIAGGQRCGSTLLYKLLDQHPEIMMAKPIRPEPKFFIRNRDYSNKRKVYKEYMNRYFKSGQEMIKYCGEKSTTYIESTSTARRINTILPDSKIIFILRDPVIRAISNYQFSVDNGIEKESFETAIARTKSELKKLDNDQISTNPFEYKERGNYINYIRNYNRVIGRKRIKIILLEELIDNIKILDDTTDWLGINRIKVFDDVTKKVNQSLTKVNVGLGPMKKLGEYYAESIASLNMELKIDVEKWTTKPWHRSI